MLVFTPPTRHRAPELKGKLKPFNPRGNYRQFPVWMAKATSKNMMVKTKDTRSLLVKWRTPIPIVMARQFSSTMKNRNASPKDVGRMVHITLRATNKFMGRARRADVKIALKDPNGHTHMYFAR